MKVYNLRTLVNLLLVLLPIGYLHSQSVVNYNFSQFGATYVPITGGTQLATGGFDDTNYPANPIGFTFWYNGIPYNTFSVNANGFLALGNTILNSYASISGGTTNQVISAYNYDLVGITPTGELRYQTLGTAPNRTLVLQWSNMRSFGGAGEFNFQIRLNESDYSIEIVYGNYVAEASIRNAEVGLRGASNTEYNNREVTNGTHTWATSVAGAANNAKCQMTTGLIPSNGQTYRWQATPPASPTTLTFSTVGPTSMTLNWIDNSTDEGSFAIYVSTDGINYNFLGTLVSSTTATTGTPYNYLATGLNPSTLYYWQVYAVAEIPSYPLSGTQSTNPGVLCGTYTVGPTGAYTSLTSAFTDLATNSLSCPCNFELQAAYNSSIETFPLNVPHFGGSAVNTVTVRPELNATALSITSADPTATLLMNGTSWITFDGRPGGIGTSRELEISNTNLTGSAILYQNNTQNTGMTYLNINGVTNGITNGVVNFANALASGGGNSNNSITFSDLFAGATNPTNMIYSNNTTAGTFNQNNIISNNTIRDYFNAGVVTNGILLNTGNNAWTISNNSFYQTAPRTYTTGNIHNIISVTNNTGGNYTITNNFLGGSAPNCGGTPYAMGGTIATRLIGINFAATGTTPSNINNNTIQNFTLNTSSGATTSNGIWCGINVTGTGTTCNVQNNTIGNTTTTGNITTTTSTSGGLTVGIHCIGTGVININNNTIGSINTLGTTGTISTSVTGINITTFNGTGLRTISGNIIGSTSILNSITTASSTGTTAGNLIGISVLIGGNYVISNNTISGLTNQYIGTSTTSLTRGIHVTSGVASITGNTITAIGTFSPSTGTGTFSSLAGIQMSSTVVGNQIISENNIGGLLNANSFTTNATQTAGIIHSGATTSITTISKNAIGFIGSEANSINAANVGILLAAGRSRTFNNLINLGLNPDATSRTGAQIYEGIRLANTANNSIFFNTVAIQGTGVASGVANTFAFNKTSSGTADSLMNNVFINNRSNATTGGTHYAIQLNNATGLTINYNNYHGNGTGHVLGRFNLVDQPTLAAWQTATGQDALSTNSAVNFVSSLDLHIDNTLPSVLESTAMPIAGINDDIDNQVRPGPTNLNGGGFFPDRGADEFDGTPIPNGNNDLAIIRLVNPNNNTCFSTNTTVTLRIRSFAITPIDFSVDNATINLNVTGPNPQVYSITLNSGIINPGDSLDVLITSTYDMSAVGNYTFSGNVTIANDLNTTNNTLTRSVFGLGETTVSTTPVSPICDGASVTLNATENAAWKQQTFSNNTPIAIPDNNLTGITSVITLPGSLSSINASDILSVTVDITHTFNADLDIYLQAPDGSQIELSTDNGGGGDGYINVTFTTNAAQNITAAPTSPNITGSWQPEQPFSLLTGTADGNWSLIVADDLGGDVGTLNSWSITLYGPAQTVTYSWSPATGLSSTTIPNPVASPTTTTVYTVQVTDERGCTATDNVTVTVNPLPSITKVTNDPTCSPGNDGSIDITVSGNSPFSFNWNTGDTTEDLTGLTFGTYTVTVTDANGCTATDATTFAVPGFTVSGVVTDVSCNSGNDGAIDVTVTGGTSPYIYSWSSGQTTEDISGVTANTYTITVTDNNGCIASNTFVVSEPTPIVITLNSLTHVDCNGNSTGAIDITVSGGTPGYSYNWISLPSTPIATTEDVSSLPAGSYEITVTDGNNCTASDTYTINEPAVLTVNSVATDVTCNGLNDGEIDITVTGGTTNYSYAWSNGATTEDISSLAPNTYTVTVTDFNGCQTTTQATITEPAVLSSSISATDALCYGSTDGTVTVTPSGGTAPYTYAWSNGGSSNSITVGIGTYTVTITDDNGCISTNSATVDQPLLLTATITTFSDVTCHNANNGSATVVAGFGTPGYTYVWTNGSTTSSVSGLDGGIYTVTVTDNNGCTASASVTINEPSPITATANITNEIWGNDGAVDITPAGGTAPYSFNWSNSASTEDIANLSGGTYTVTITDDNGCTQSFTYTVISQLGINGETTGLGTINFYPNPSNGQLNMSVAGFSGGTLQMDVLDMNGKVVFVKQIKNAPESFIQEMDLRTLTMGTYFIRVTSENGVHTSRIIIARD